MGVIRYGRTAQIGVYPGNQSGNMISYRSGFAKPPFGDDTTLWYDFAGDKSLAGKIGPTLDFTRASIGSYVGADKLIKYAQSNEPRFDHDPVTGESLGLLIEEARTNLCLDSEDFTGTNWTTNGAITTNDVIAPDGALTADTLAFDSVSPANVNQNLDGNSTGVDFIASVFMKAAGTDWGRVTIVGNGAQTIWQYYDLINGVTGTPSGVDVLDSGIEDYGNGWFRCWLRFTGVDPLWQLRLFPAVTDNDIIVQPGDSISLWGAMAEQGAFPTSYIPTRPPLTVVTTRAADLCSTILTTPQIGDAGTFYINFTIGLSNAPWAGSFSDSVAGNFTGHQLVPTGNNLQYRFYDPNNTQQVNQTPIPNVPLNSRYKIAAAVAANDAAVYTNGAGLFDNAVALTPLSLDRIIIGGVPWGPATTQKMNGHIREFSYANVRKDNTFLQDLTAP